MADITAAEASETSGSSTLPLIAGLFLALVGAGGGYFAVTSGLFASGESVPEKTRPAETETKPDVAFLPVEPLTVSLPSGSSAEYLRFRAELEVAREYAEEVAQYMPRFVDVLNTYLRALEVRDLEDPTALTRLRTQMLRRVQIVAGPDRINDLLVMEFVLQ